MNFKKSTKILSDGMIIFLNEMSITEKIQYKLGDLIKINPYLYCLSFILNYRVSYTIHFFPNKTLMIYVNSDDKPQSIIQVKDYKDNDDAIIRTFIYIHETYDERYKHSISKEIGERGDFVKQTIYITKEKQTNKVNHCDLKLFHEDIDIEITMKRLKNSDLDIEKIMREVINTINLNLYNKQ